MVWLIESNVCPGLFYGTSAQDGFLIRLRTPGGGLNHQQGYAIATLAEQWESDAIQVTNRANVQIRSGQNSPTAEVLQTLQTLGLAAQNSRIDHLRNVMTSPTAGIDPQELIDTRPWVRALDAYIQSHVELADLSPKFSIGIDGGGAVGIGTRSAVLWEHRYNEIQLSAVVACGQAEAGGCTVNPSPLPPPAPPSRSKNIYFRLALGADKQLCDTQVLIAPDDCVAVVAALVKAYLVYGHQSPRLQKKPRMKHLLQDWGVERYLQQVNQYLPDSLRQVTSAPPLSPTQPYAHLGVHPQRQAGLSYIGVHLRLGHLTATQLSGLAQLAETFGSGDLRLTPWQTVLLPDIADRQVLDVLQNLSSLGLVVSDNRVDAAIAACAGKPGCAAAETQTQAHAIALANHLNQHLALASPVNIHLTGCPKSCAQPSPTEIMLLGTRVLAQGDGNQQDVATVEGYHIYIGGHSQSPDALGRGVVQHSLCEVTASELPSTIEHLVMLYKQYRETPNESFGEFMSKRSSIELLDKWRNHEKTSNSEVLKQ